MDNVTEDMVKSSKFIMDKVQEAMHKPMGVWVNGKKTYRVKVTKETYFDQYVYVEAKNIEDARSEAIGEACDLDDWEENGTADYEAEVVEEDIDDE